MNRRTLAACAALSLLGVGPATLATAQESRPTAVYHDELDRYSAEQLDNLVGSIALYPDALLAQVLVAATFPDQIVDAARFVRVNGTGGIDDQAWDVSVKAVAHYPAALNMMADKSDWTTALGRAYASQSSDVMAAVQRLRAMADAQGNLRSTQEQSVSRDDDNYVIAPAQTRVIYVPVYDAYEVYRRPIFRSAYSSFWSFGVGFPIGSWLSYDLNWRNRSVYYNGWEPAYFGYAGGWRVRSRPFIQFTNIYVNPRYRSVYFNRDVIRRRVEYRNVDRYPGVHRDTRFSRGPVVIYRDNRSRSYDAGTVYDNGRRPDGGSRYDNDRRDVPPRARDDYRSDRQRGADDNRDGDRQRTVYDGWNVGRDPRSRDNRSTNAPPPQRTERDRGPVHIGMWGSEPPRVQPPREQQQQQQQPPRSEPARDGRSGEREGRDRARDGARQPDWERPSNTIDRGEMPLINPRRAEPREQGRPDGARGGDQNQGNGQRSPRAPERERPKL